MVGAISNLDIFSSILCYGVIDNKVEPVSIRSIVHTISKVPSVASKIYLSMPCLTC